MLPALRNPFVAAMAAVTLLRLAMTAVTPMAPDEAYYWVWSQALAPGYLDHPPMVAVWIRAGTMILGQTALGVRLLGPLSAALASWLLFDTARLLLPGGRAGVAAVLLLNASLVIGVGSVIMTPDTPLLFFWTATMWALAHVAAGRSGGWWLVAGVFAGLAMDSKYTGLFLWVGAGLWVLLVPAARCWLRRWQPYVACVIGLLLFTPVLAWNADHHWVGLLRQGGRVGDWHPLRAVGFLGELIGGQIGLATPLVWVLCMIGLAAGVSRACTRRDPAWSLLTALSLPPVLVFIQHAVGDRVQGNWPAIIYPSLAIAAGGAIRDRRWIVAASALGLAITLLVYGQVLTGWLPVPPRLDPIAIRLAGWTALGRQIEATASVNAVSFVAAENYALAAELAWSTQGRIAIVGTDQRWRLTALPTFPIAGQVGLLVRDVRRLDPPDPAVWATAQRLDDVVRPASGTPGFAVYRVTAAQHAEPGELISPVRQTKSSQAIGG